MLKPDCARRKSCQSAFGQGFDSPQLHHLDRTRTRECGPFSLILQKIDVGLDTRPLQGHFSRRNVLALPAEAVDFPHQEAVEAPILRVSQHPLKLVTASSAPDLLAQRQNSQKIRDTPCVSRIFWPVFILPRTAASARRRGTYPQATAAPASAAPAPPSPFRRSTPPHRRPAAPSSRKAPSRRWPAGRR